MAPTRIHPYAAGDDLPASQAFYTEVLGFEVAMEEPALGLTSPTNRTAQVIIPPTGFEDPQPAFGETSATRRRSTRRTPLRRSAGSRSSTH